MRQCMHCARIVGVGSCGKTGSHGKGGQRGAVGAGIALAAACGVPEDREMIQGWAVIGTAFVYLLALFAVASYGDRRRKQGVEISSRPNIYAFSLAIYCT